MSKKKSIGFVLGGLIAFSMAGCDNDQSKLDPEGPQPPPSNEEVDSAKGTPGAEVEVVEIVDAAPVPDFDVSALPGVAARGWSQTDGGSWYATVMPGTGGRRMEPLSSCPPMLLMIRSFRWDQRCFQVGMRHLQECK